jgi:hypothetical protein
LRADDLFKEKGVTLSIAVQHVIAYLMPVGLRKQERAKTCIAVYLLTLATKLQQEDETVPGKCSFL